MKILHVSDSHLGYSAYRKSTEEGINQREIDVYNAFEQFIDYAVDKKPDLIIHAGDLFDSVRPNNRSISFAMNQLLRLSENKIPTVIISGNHEQPKLKETGHIFSIFDHIDFVYPVYNSKYEKYSFKIKDEEVIVHAVPQCNSKKEFDTELKKLKPDEKSSYNIFTAHGAVTGIKEFSMNEFNELLIPTKIVNPAFDYVALGHYHKYTQLDGNAFYAGATESLSFNDANEKKGFIDLDLNKNGLKHTFIEIKTRPMVDVKPIKCSNLKLDEVMKKIKQTVQEIKPKEKTFRVTLDDIPAHIYRSLDFSEIRKISNDAIHFEIKANVVKDGELKQQTSSKIDALTNEFKLFLEANDINEKETLLDLGIGYIEKIEAQKEGK